MKMDRELICFDIETTGFKPSEHSLIQFAYIILDKDYNQIESYKTLVKPPESAIWTDAATSVHGITKDMVEHERTFKEVAQEIIDAFKGRDILTYNGNTFDIPFLVAEFERINIEFDISDSKTYDSFKIETEIYSKKLGRTFTRYTGKTMEESGLQPHDALSDVKATIDIFKHQANVIDVESVPCEVSLTSVLSKINGEWIWSVGKYKDEKVKTTIKRDPDYVSYMVRSVGSKFLFNTVKTLYKEVKEEQE